MNSKWRINTFLLSRTCYHLYYLMMEASHKSLDTSKIWYYFNIIEVAFQIIFHVVYKKLALLLPICLQKDRKGKRNSER